MPGLAASGTRRRRPAAPADVDLEAGLRAGPARAGGPRPPRASGPGRRGAGGRDLGLEAGELGPGGVALGVEGGGDDVVRPRARPGAARRRRATRSPRRAISPYLRRSSWSSWRRAPTSAWRSGSSSMASPRRRTSAARSASSAATPCSRVDGVGERRATVEGGEGDGHRVGGAPVARERLHARPRRPRGGRRRRPGPPPRRAGARPRRRRSRPAAAELVDLEAQQVDLPGPLALVAAEGGQALLDAGELLAGGAERLEVDAAEAVEGPALHRGREQRLVVVLAVEVDERRRRARPARRAWRGGRRRRPASGPTRARPGAARPRRRRPRTDPRPRPRRHRGAPWPGSARPPTSSSMAVDDEGLAGAGLAGHRGHAGAEHQRQLGDDAEVGDAQLGQHRSSPVRQPELGLQDGVEVAGPEDHEAGHVAGGPAPHDVAGLELAERPPVDHERRGPVARRP